MKKNRRRRGQSILESTLSMLLLSLILVGLLQLFHLYVAQMLTDFSAFYTARSRSVGFDDYIVERAGRVIVAGASGPRSWPSESFGDSGADNASERTYNEEMTLHEYICGVRWLQYQYWSGQNDYGSQWSSRAEETNTTFVQSLSSGSDNLLNSTVYFANYPFALFELIDPGNVWFERDENEIDIRAESEQIDYSNYYLEED